MKRLVVMVALIAVLALVVTGVALALTDDDPVTDSAVALAQEEGEQSTEEPFEPKPERTTLLSEVLAELVEEGVIDAEQAEIIEDRLRAAKEERGRDFFHEGRGFHFRFPRGCGLVSTHWGWFFSAIHRGQ